MVSAKDGKELATQIAPLVNDATLMVAHADLAKLDLNAIGDNAANGLEEPLANCGFDASSVKGIAREAKKLILQGKTKLVDFQKSLTEKTGVSDVYAVCQFTETGDEPAKGLFIYLAFPNEGRKPAQLKELVELFYPAIEAEGVWTPFEHKGFQIVVLRDQQHDGVPLEEIEHFFETQKPTTIPGLAEAFDRCRSATIYGVFRLPAKMFDKFINEPLSDENFKDLPSRDKIMALAERWKENIPKFQWSAWSLDLNAMESTGVIRMADAAAAKEIRGLAEETINRMGDVIREGIQKEPEAAFVGPFLGELFKGAYQAYLPTTAENELVIQYKFERWGNAILGIYVGLANFVLPIEE